MALLNLLLRPRAFRFALLCALLPLGGPAASAADQNEVHAVFLLNLSRFIRWPDAAFSSPEAPLVIGYFANAPIADPLIAAARGEVADRRPIQVRELRAASDLDGCHIVFFSKADTANLAQLLASLRAKPVLTVGDADGFLRLGGQVQLYTRGGQVRLRLDLRNLKRAELSASAPLLRVAEIVEN